MKVFYEGTLIAFNKKEFFDKETGDTIKYNELQFLSENDDGTRDVLRLTGSLDLSIFIDQKGILELEVDPAAKRKTRYLAFAKK